MVVSPTTLRKAIYWSDKYIDNMYFEVKVKEPLTGLEKTYGLVSACPGLPLWIQLPDGNYLAPLGRPTHFHIPFTGDFHYYGWPWYVAMMSDTIQTGEALEVVYMFIVERPWDYLCQNFELCEIRVRYEPDPADSTKMKLTVTPTKWVGYCQLWPSTRYDTADLYIGDKLLIKDIPKHINESISVSTASYGAFRSYTYAVRHDITQAALYYWYDRPACRDRAQKMFKLLDDYGFDFEVWETLWRQSDAKDFEKDLYNMDKHFRDCDVALDLPWGPYYHPFISSRCACPDCQTVLIRDVGAVPIKCTLAIHIMNKYGDPKAKINIHPGATTCLESREWHDATYILKVNCVSAEDLLLYGFNPIWIPITFQFHIPAVISSYVPGKGIELKPGTGIYSAGSTAFALAAFSELGYGFDYGTVDTEAGTLNIKEVADDLAECLIKMQWGYPNYDGRGRDEHYGLIRRPDHNGGFMLSVKYVDGSVPVRASAPRSLLDQVLTMLADELVAPSVPESLLFTPTSTEMTITCNKALRIYEYYKYRAGG